MATSSTAVATTTLEPGIDMGDVETIAQIGPGFSVASLRQRLGRSGRRPGKPAMAHRHPLRQYRHISPQLPGNGRSKDMDEVLSHHDRLYMTFLYERRKKLLYPYILTSSSLSHLYANKVHNLPIPHYVASHDVRRVRFTSGGKFNSEPAC